MKGLELAERYFFEYGLPMIRRAAPCLEDRCAAGLAGPGSECYGFDDELSRDHDWGPAFCLWLNDSDYEEYGGQLTAEYQKLPGVFEGYGPRISLEGENHRTGIIRAGDFFKRYLGRESLSCNPGEGFKEWLIPEENFGLCTNGKIFHDPTLFFTNKRDDLIKNYPLPVKMKRIAARCMEAGQAGQYNLQRVEQRGEVFAAAYERVRFCESSMKLVFLLNGSFPPFYKWLHRAVRGLEILGEEAFFSVLSILSESDSQKSSQLISGFSRKLADELRAQRYSASESHFLVDHALTINNDIEDEALKRLPFSYL